MDLIVEDSNDSLKLDRNVIFSEGNHLAIFLKNWDKNYLHKIKKIPLFDQNKTSHWSESQKTLFIKLFYHIRGHFHEFLWTMGNYAPNSIEKSVILKNISEEFGGNGYSHEQLYMAFAESMGVNLKQEILTEETNLPFIRDFNKGHINWLHHHDWESAMAIFSAYERLDNIDYVHLLSLAKSISHKTTKRVNLAFFNVHARAQHFLETVDSIMKTWENNSFIIIQAFNFIGTHQLKMWKNLSKTIFDTLKE